MLERAVMDELKVAGFTEHWTIQPIREKSGIYVFRITKHGESYVCKYFSEEQPHGMETLFYTIFASIGVPTLKVIAHTKNLIVLEDILTNSQYRLGSEADTSDPQVAYHIGNWFRKLHDNGRTYADLSNIGLLDTVENELSNHKIRVAMEKSNTPDNPFWSRLMDNLGRIKRTHARLCDTLVHHDFWWDNLAVAKDASSALMFDYNYVYRSYAYTDVRHVLSVLSETAGIAFMEGYGDCSEQEKLFEEMYRTISGLIAAYNMDEFPEWGKGFEAMLRNGELVQLMQK